MVTHGRPWWGVVEVIVATQHQSQSHITTDGQSVNMSRYRAHSGTCDQILLSVRRLFSGKADMSLVTRQQYCPAMFSIESAPELCKANMTTVSYLTKLQLK
jgi:hypothetical protein